MKHDIRMPLYEIRLSVEGKCNYNCIYCGPFADGKKSLGYGNLPLEQIDKIGKLIKKYNLHVQITGGEPSLRKDLDKIVSIFSLNGIKDVGISTNGSKLDIRYISRMIANGLKEIHFHVPSTNQEIYEKTVRNTKHIKDILALSIYSKNKINVEFNTPVTALNISTMPDLLNFCLNNGINIKFIEEVSLSKDRIKKETIESCLEDWLIKKDIRFTKKLLPKKYGYIYNANIPIQIRIAPVTPNLIEHLKGELQNILLDGRFWIGGQNGKFVYTSSYFIRPKIGTFEDLETALDDTVKLYETKFKI